jgi:TonB family protein
MNLFRAPLLGACLICAGIPAIAAAPAASPQEPIRTAFAVLVGYPSKDQSASGGALLVPGTVIPLTEEPAASSDIGRRQIVEKSLAFSKAAEKLWITFRLDPARQRQDGKSEMAAIGKAVDLPPLQDANIKMTATLLRYDNNNATYRIVFRQGETNLADSTVVVARGGRAVVGGMDGPAAPYLFVFVEPEAPTGSKAGTRPAASAQGITEPKLIYSVPPKYPADAKKEKVEGVVVLNLIIDVDGAVLDVSVLEDPDPRLTKEAVETVRQWKFRPALDIKGQPVKVQSTVSVRFKLQ